jgi:hypothetical protein
MASRPPATSASPKKSSASHPEYSDQPEIDSLIREAKRERLTQIAFRTLPDLETLPAFRLVVGRYLGLTPPPVFTLARSLGAKYSRAEAAHSTTLLAWGLLQLRRRIVLAGGGVLTIKWDRHWRSERAKWKEEQAKLVSLLNQAADLFDSGQCDPGPYASFTGYKSLSTPNFSGVDEIDWCGTENLRRWAQLIKMSPVEIVFPKARPNPPDLLFRPDIVGTRGGASDDEGALRAMVVREISKHIPEEMLSQGGYQAISALTMHLGLTHVSRQYVASLLKKGRT